MTAVTPDQILKILELTDSFSLHRESVVIPLATKDSGGVVILPDQRLQIIVPNNRPFDEWFVELQGTLSSMDLSNIRH
jgi:hypothetical protein